MKIGPDFEITVDPFNWIVAQWVPGKDKEGNPKPRRKLSYHASLLQACTCVLDALAHDAAIGTVEDVIAAVSRAEAAICEAIREKQP